MRWLFVAVFFSAFSCSAFSQGVNNNIVLPSLEFNWFVPSLRENGDVLPLAEIGGYELRWKIKGTKNFRSVVIRGGSNKSYILKGLVLGAYECEIATFDADGLYSRFVPIKYKLISIPKPILKPTVPGVNNCNPGVPCKM
ncbi:hypothetical protein GCM10011613_10470 [Cellvibrio zantedeschiae]|uniref:Ig-like domain-containing protein n=1 Tax=Cellvibrio zantedeschiae TaxID=1237077 RepID=A0ABQ3AVY1_9GAMM|nr:hypothetical protein [Cellvibrio zantedeschiae]GGY68169.1 hypothetical protein GCM10011613_10470 [Cellvibrio zantedeschiae]